MKKILFSFMALMLCGFVSYAQSWGDVRGQVLDANGFPVQGVAVFMYGSYSTFVGNGQDPSSYGRFDYTSGNGFYWMQYYGVPAGDSVVVGVLDSNMNMSWSVGYVAKSRDTVTVNVQMLGTVPSACSALVSAFKQPSGGVMYEAIALRDSVFASIPWPTMISHDWTFSDGYIAKFPDSDVNVDSVWRPASSFLINPDSVSYCYQRTNLCAPVCGGQSSTPTPTGHSCNADFFVDSVNSINFNGQVVVWENSTADTGASIIGYRWDFGDGTPTVNQQYPTHTYSDTGVYQVCLTIVSVKQTATRLDTCTSTYCDSIGFDSNGNLIYKSSGQGFTINVVDPATVGQNEIDLSSMFRLYPNPSSEKATLSWDEAIGVEKIDVLSINGEHVRSVAVDGKSQLELNSLQSGVYLIRVETNVGVTALRMIVQ